MKRYIFISVLLALLAVFLSACAGEDGTAYISEEVTAEIEQGSETWNELSEMLGMLTVDSTEIPQFDSMKESVGYFRDSVLNYLCCKNYRKYAGNAELLGEINEKYPGMDAIAAISADEFEAEMYRTFGGNVKITHRSTTLFTYLEKADVYVPITSPIEKGCDLTLVSAEETKNTYRVEFEASSDGVVSRYFTLLIKREDGSCYYSMLLKH